MANIHVHDTRVELIPAGVRFAGWIIVAIAVVGQLLVRPSPDVSWLLYAARELLHGARLGVDVLEVTPPMIFLLKLPVVGVAELLGIGVWEAWVCSMAVLVAGSLVLTRRLLPTLLAGDRSFEDTATLTIAFLMLVLPGDDFGQKEHLTAVLILPYVVLSSRRLTLEAVSPGLAVVAGVLGGIAIGIKPHFLIVFAGLLVLEAWRLGRQLPRAEHLSVVLVGVLYLTLVGVVAPGYYAYALDYGALYRDFLPHTLWGTVLIGNGTLSAFIAVGVFVGIRRYLSAPGKALADALACATGAFYLAAVLQGKGWRYHFLPSIIFATLLLALLPIAKMRRLPRLHRLYHGIGVAVLVATLFSPLSYSVWRLLAPSSSFHDADPNFGTLMPIIRELGDGATVAVFSSNITSAFPLILESGARWPLRFPSLWPLIAFYSDSLEWGRTIEPSAPDRWNSLERSFADGIIQDLERTPPILLIVLRPDPKAFGWGGARQFEYLRYFTQNPRFRDFLAGYQFTEDVGDYDLYRRGTDALPPLFSEGTVSKVSDVPRRPSPPRVDVFAWILTAVGAGLGFWGGWQATGAGPSNSVSAKRPPSS